MKTTKILSFAVLMAAMTGMTGITFDQAFAAPGKGGSSEVGGVGSDGYKLQLIGIDKSDHFTNDETNNSKNIFVKLWGKSKISLQEGPTFDVIDSDATDGDGGKFQLPNPGTCDPTDPDFEKCTLSYKVYLRLLGNPHTGNFGMVTCAEEDGQVGGTATEDEILCSVESVDLPNDNGKGNKSKWNDVSRELLTMCVDADTSIDSGSDMIPDNDCDIRVALFDDDFVDYFWEVDNNGHKLAQLLFKPNV